MSKPMVIFITSEVGKSQRKSASTASHASTPCANIAFLYRPLFLGKLFTKSYTLEKSMSVYSTHQEGATLPWWFMGLYG